MMRINYPSVPTCCGECPCLHYTQPVYCQAVCADREKRITSPFKGPRPGWCPIEEEHPLPVKVHMERILWDDSGDEAIWVTDKLYDCPRCGKRLNKTYPKEEIKYCSNCGQGVVWDE